MTSLYISESTIVDSLLYHDTTAELYNPHATKREFFGVSNKKKGLGLFWGIRKD